MQVIKAVTKRGDRDENEDTYGCIENAFWVIDGATDLFDLGLSKGDDVAFYVQNLSHEISGNFNINKSLSEIVREAILGTNKKCKIDTTMYETYKFPSFAIAIVRYTDNRLEYLVLGDCSIIAKVNGEIIEITDTRIAEFSDLNKKGIEKMREQGTLNHNSELSLFQRTRSYMNIENGYWIGSVDPVGVSHALTGEFEIDDKTQIICCTDGFIEAFKTFNISEINEETFDDKILEKIENELRKRQDGDCNRNITRVRVKDDLTYILAR